MSKVKVAILDSGINYKDEYFKNYIFSGKNLNKSTKNFYDDNGHGSLCASTIIKEEKNVSLYIVKILDSRGIANIEILKKALYEMLGLDIKIILMSLSIYDGENDHELREICKKLYLQDKIIIAALSNGCKKSYPAIYKWVYGVRGFILETDKVFWFNKNKKIEVIVDNNPYFHRNNKGEYELFGKCNSYSAAKFAGIVCKIVKNDNNMSIKKLNYHLKKLSKRHIWNELYLKKSKRYPIWKKTSIYDTDYEKVRKIVEKVITNYYGISNNEEIYNVDLFSSKIGMNYKNAFYILKKINAILNIKQEYYTNVSRYDMFCTQNIINCVLDMYKSEKIQRDNIQYNYTRKENL